MNSYKLGCFRNLCSSIPQRVKMSWSGNVAIKSIQNHPFIYSLAISDRFEITVPPL